MQEVKIIKMPKRKKPAPQILSKLDSLNKGAGGVKLRYRHLTNKKYSLYLDIYHNGERIYEFLKIYISGTPDHKDEDMEKLEFAKGLRAKRELELLQNVHGLKKNIGKSKANFIEFYNKIKDQKTSNIHWANTYKHLTDFFGQRTQFRAVTPSKCEKFRDYLVGKVSNNSVRSYFHTFKMALRMAVKEGIIDKSPAQSITIKREEIEREFLTESELKKLKETPLYHQEVKNAFLFACFTGLRLSDIKALEFEQINEGYLSFRQKKTKGVERMKLNENAMEILEEQKQTHPGSKLVFKMPKTRDHINLLLKSWASFAGINKNLHFHLSRHTFATMLLTHDADLYTVSKLLGHKEIRSTQIYAKLIDKKKDEAIDKLPKI